MWRLPAASLEGSHASPERTLQTTPLATTVRPYAPGDSMNRIHWKSTARHGDIQVKEFDLEQTADAWIILDLQRGIQAGRGEESTTEAMIRAAASIADKALTENRAVGMTVNAGRTAYLPADRGGRQHQKVMQLLAAVDADSSTALVETLIASVGRLRRGMTAVVITASSDPSWIRPLASLRTRGIGCVVVLADAAAYAQAEAEARAEVTGVQLHADPVADEAVAKRRRALNHALAEYELAAHTLRPESAARRRSWSHDHPRRTGPARIRCVGSTAGSRSASSCSSARRSPGRSTTRCWSLGGTSSPTSCSGRPSAVSSPGSSARSRDGAAGRPTSSERSSPRCSSRCSSAGR